MVPHSWGLRLDTLPSRRRPGGRSLHPVLVAPVRRQVCRSHRLVGRGASDANGCGPLSRAMPSRRRWTATSSARSRKFPDREEKERPDFFYSTFAQGSNLLASGEIIIGYGIAPMRVELKRRGLNITGAWPKEGVLSLIQHVLHSEGTRRTSRAHTRSSTLCLANATPRRSRTIGGTCQPHVSRRKPDGSLQEGIRLRHLRRLLEALYSSSSRPT